MKLVTFREKSEPRAGMVLGAEIVDLERGFAWLAKENGEDASAGALRERYGQGVLGFIERDGEARPAADRLAAMHADGKLPTADGPSSIVLPAGSVTLLSPLPQPPSMRDGYAFRQHVETARRNRGVDMIPEFDEFPVFYFTNHHGVIGPGELRVQSRHLERLDFELEAAIVVGKRGRNVPASRADELIYGMTIMNDFSARALQMQEMKLSLGPAKGKDFATALGPYLVTMDELASVTKKSDRGASFDMEMRAFVNDVQVSTGNVKDMTWTFAQILERASYGVTLVPGEVIGSGTCGTGCFLELNGSKITDNQWLKVGDRVALEIDGLGRLEHQIALDDGKTVIG